VFYVIKYCCRLENELSSKAKERDMAFERESSVKLSLQRVQNDLLMSEERYKRLDDKVCVKILFLYRLGVNM